MAVENRRADRALSAELSAEAYRFDFFQAVRLLERMAREQAPDAQHAPGPVGEDYPPGQEVVRFRALPSLGFPAGAVSRVNLPQVTPTSGSPAPPEMIVSFLGLFGPNGVLPRHYTSLVVDRCHPRHKDYSLRDFLDLFNHRIISLFYRAWEKYRFSCGYERAQEAGPGGECDLFTAALFALVGLGTPGLTDRLAIDDESIIYYGGHFAHWPRSPLSLEALLADYFELPVEVQPFRGQWLRLNEEQRSALPGPKCPEGRNHKLGESVVVGARVWSIQSKFRVLVGPVDYQQFQEFMPTGEALKRLTHLARLYVGQEFDFDVQVELLAREVPWCKLGATPATARRLGWNSWVRCGEFKRNVKDAVFSLDGK